ncbi:SIS domain-containing protein [Reyranella sp.]|uniref:SIS domain-containing protein n=1 Tax=Reyranella sp. TaxID=1929291 RepID=UPI003BAB4DB9
MSFTQTFLRQVGEIAASIDVAAVDGIVDGIADVRGRGGRLFILGVGGSAANASHAVNDFRKLCDVEAYAPTDNVSELTARTNDDGWSSVFAAWLKTSRANDKDAILVLSVGGGDRERNVSPNLVEALDEALRRGLAVFGIVGRDGGYTARVAHAVVKIPVVDAGLVTPHSEAFQAVVWHCLVSHPKLMVNRTKW